MPAKPGDTTYKYGFFAGENIDESLLEDIEKTTIIKLNNMKSFKVSPYKKKTNSNIEDNSEYHELDKNVENGIINTDKNKMEQENNKVVEKETTKEYNVKNDFNNESVEDVETI